MKVPNTICPGVAGFVSWATVSSVFSFRVKHLPLAVAMVIVPPWVSCLQRSEDMFSVLTSAKVKFAVRSVFCMCLCFVHLRSYE